MASPNVIINGSTYNGVPSVQIPKSGSGTATFYYTEDASAGAGDILATKKAFGTGGEITGSMANNGATGGTISTKAGSVSIPAGYTSGGSVTISSTEQAKIIAGNIKSGVTLLGQAGSSMVVDTTISTDAAAAGTIISGKKAYVNGSLITGNATAPTVSQDSSTHVLSIS
jgi:hypothetical protein